jgi:hypothetical protein
MCTEAHDTLKICVNIYIYIYLNIYTFVGIFFITSVYKYVHIITNVWYIQMNRNMHVYIWYIKMHTQRYTYISIHIFKYKCK